MIDIQKVPTDPAWDYNSIWETLEEMQNSITLMINLLSSEAAEEGNEKIDVEILRALAQIKGDCLGIEKALASEDELEISPDSQPLQCLKSIAKSSAESVSMLRSMELTITHIDEMVSKASVFAKS